MNWSSLIYIELSHDGFSARNLYKNNINEHSNNDSLRFPPEELKAAFGHPRLIVADFLTAERLFFKMIRPLCKRNIIRPRVIVRIAHRFAEDISPVEKRATRCDSSRRCTSRLSLARTRSDRSRNFKVP